MAEQNSTIASGVSPIAGSGLLEVVFGLAFVVILIFALAWLYRRFGGTGLGMGGLIKVIAAMSLGNRDRIALISVGEQQLLIGISPGRISTLHVFDEAIDTDAAVDSINNSGNSDLKQDFARKLQSVMSGSKT